MHSGIERSVIGDLIVQKEDCALSKKTVLMQSAKGFFL